MNNLKLLKFGMSVLAVVLAIHSGLANEISNNGFEETRVWKASNPYFKAIKDGEWAVPDPLMVPKGLQRFKFAAKPLLVLHFVSHRILLIS